MFSATVFIAAKEQNFTLSTSTSLCHLLTVLIQLKVKVKSSPSGESITIECGFNYQLLAVPLKYPNWGPLVSVDHNQLWTMASETVDPIDWSHPPHPQRAVTPS